MSVCVSVDECSSFRCMCYYRTRTQFEQFRCNVRIHFEEYSHWFCLTLVLIRIVSRRFTLPAFWQNICDAACNAPFCHAHMFMDKQKCPLFQKSRRPLTQIYPAKMPDEIGQNASEYASKRSLSRLFHFPGIWSKPKNFSHSSSCLSTCRIIICKSKYRMTYEMLGYLFSLRTLFTVTLDHIRCKVDLQSNTFSTEDFIRNKSFHWNLSIIYFTSCTMAIFQITKRFSCF